MSARRPQKTKEPGKNWNSVSKVFIAVHGLVEVVRHGSVGIYYPNQVNRECRRSVCYSRSEVIDQQTHENLGIVGICMLSPTRTNKAYGTEFLIGRMNDKCTQLNVWGIIRVEWSEEEDEDKKYVVNFFIDRNEEAMAYVRECMKNEKDQNKRTALRRPRSYCNSPEAQKTHFDDSLTMAPPPPMTVGQDAPMTFAPPPVWTPEPPSPMSLAGFPVDQTACTAQSAHEQQTPIVWTSEPGSPLTVSHLLPLPAGNYQPVIVALIPEDETASANESVAPTSNPLTPATGSDDQPTNEEKKEATTKTEPSDLLPLLSHDYELGPSLHESSEDPRVRVTTDYPSVTDQDKP